MKKSIIKLSFAAILATLVPVCSAVPINPVSSPDVAMAYGNITLPEGNITDVLLYKVDEGDAPPVKSPHQSHTYANGDYFIENIEPGKYFLREFVAGKEQFNLNYQGIDEAKFIKDVAVEVKHGSATYFGSYDVTGIDNKFQKSSSYAITHNKYAARMLILKHLKAEVQGTGWDKLIDRAMK
jgi:hypothetical protein